MVQSRPKCFRGGETSVSLLNKSKRVAIQNTQRARAPCLRAYLYIIIQVFYTLILSVFNFTCKRKFVRTDG